MRPLAYLLALALMVGPIACGRATPTAVRSSRPRTATTGASSRQPERDPDDHDGDNPHARRYDADDQASLDFGKPASPRDAHAIATVLKRYYRAASRDDGLGACRLLAASTVDDYTAKDGSLPSRRSELAVCRSVVSRLIGPDRGKFGRDLADMRLVRAGVEGDEALAVLTFGTRRLHWIQLERSPVSWGLLTLWDQTVS